MICCECFPLLYLWRSSYYLMQISSLILTFCLFRHFLTTAAVHLPVIEGPSPQLNSKVENVSPHFTDGKLRNRVDLIPYQKQHRNFAFQTGTEPTSFSPDLKSDALSFTFCCFSSLSNMADALLQITAPCQKCGREINKSNSHLHDSCMETNLPL